MGVTLGSYSHPGVLQDRPCDGDTLLLTAAQLDAALADLTGGWGGGGLNLHLVLPGHPHSVAISLPGHPPSFGPVTVISKGIHIRPSPLTSASRPHHPLT